MRITPLGDKPVPERCMATLFLNQKGQQMYQHREFENLPLLENSPRVNRKNIPQAVKELTKQI